MATFRFQLFFRQYTIRMYSKNASDDDRFVVKLRGI